MLCFPNCKINLGLSVISKRPDGFHNIETLMVPVDLNDVLEIIPSSTGNNSFHISGIKLGGETEDNLVLQAYELLRHDFDLPRVFIHLHKHIPPGAGLGGGSADAAFTIKLLDEIFNLQLTPDHMESYARKIGSDCAFFIRNKPVLAFDKGDRFLPVNVDIKNYHLVIIKSEIHISTPLAYSWVNPTAKKSPLETIITRPVEEWKSILINDFEPEVFEHHPEIKKIKDKLYKAGAIYASLTGSGAAVFGIFGNETGLEKDFKDCFVWGGKLFS